MTDSDPGAEGSVVPNASRVPETPRALAAREFALRTSAAIEALAEAFDASFDEAVTLLAGAHRIVVTGVGKSGLIGQKIAATLSSTGSPAHFLHATEAAHGDLGIVTRDDAVIAISNSGSSSELTAIVEYCRRFSVPLVGITSKRDSTLGRRADLVLTLPERAEAGPIPSAPMTSTTMTLVLGDALASALTREKGFEADDFHKFHPGGRIGVQTLKLRALIERERREGDGDAMRLVTIGANEPIDRLAERISEGGKGMVGVIEREGGPIVGSVTDGDLRRALADIRAGRAETVGAVMHRDPIHLSDGDLVADALATCERHRIGGVFVTGGDGRAYAVVHVQDLLRTGAA